MRKPIPRLSIRITWLVIYFLALLWIHSIINGTWLPDTGAKSAWFYTATISLLLGDLIFTPYYITPRNTLGASIPVALTLWIIIDRVSIQYSFLAKALLLYCCLVGLLAIISSLLSSSSSEEHINESLSQTLKSISKTFGHPKVLFTSLFVIVILEFHMQSPMELLLVVGTWVVLVGIQPERLLYWSWHKVMPEENMTTDFGSVAAYQSPRIILVRQETQQRIDMGSILLCNDEHGPMRLSVAVNYTGRDDALLIRSLDVSHIPAVQEWISSLNVGIPQNRVGLLERESIPSTVLDDVPIISGYDDFVGIISENSNINRIYFEVIEEKEIRDGQLVEVDIGGTPVLYQVIDGLTREDIIYKKNKYGYARAEAEKIGVWDDEEQRFEKAKWLPEINTPVFLPDDKSAESKPSTVGHFPGTEYPVGIDDVNDLVTYNTAILGVLGIGKSMLSIELVERILAENVKVVCLDLTDQYSKQLSMFFDEEQHKRDMERIHEASRKDRDEHDDNPEKGGSFPNLKDEIRNDLEQFMQSDSRSLKIYNPAEFTATRQEREPSNYKDESGEWQRTAALWSVTPVQITQVVAESLLALVQDEMRDEAKVCLVLEEAHSLVPEWNTVANDADKNATNATARAILQGRKFGMGCLLVTQRTASVRKTVINQCNTIFAMRSFDETGKNFLSNYIGDDYAEMLPSLDEREAVFFGKASTCENPVHVRLNDRDKFRDMFRKAHPPQSPEVAEEAVVEEDEISDLDNQ